jgi:CheY-like chemotaxis protein
VGPLTSAGFGLVILLLLAVGAFRLLQWPITGEVPVDVLEWITHPTAFLFTGLIAFGLWGELLQGVLDGSISSTVSFFANILFPFAIIGLGALAIQISAWKKLQRIKREKYSSDHWLDRMLRGEHLPSEHSEDMRPKPRRNLRSETIRVAIVDDEPKTVEILQQVLTFDPEIQVVATGSDGLDAIEIYDSFVPDVMIMCVMMPRMDGITATRSIVQNHPGAKVIILTATDPGQTEELSYQSGASLFMSKPAGYGDLVTAIRRVAD